MLLFFCLFTVQQFYFSLEIVGISGLPASNLYGTSFCWIICAEHYGNGEFLKEMLLLK